MTFRKSIFLCIALSMVAALVACSSSSKTPTSTVAITASNGGGQSAQVGTQFEANLSANVTTNGTATSGASVVFTCPASGASCTFASTGTNTETVTTDSGGDANSSAVTANSTAGSYNVTAATGSASVNFGLTNTAAPVPVITATAGTPQSTLIGTAFATALSANVTLSGTAVAGASVTFTAPATDPTGTFTSTGTNTETDTTDANGNVTSSAFTASGVAGGYTVMATTPGAAGAANFSLSNTSGTPVTITASSGGGQTATVSGAFGAPLVANVVDGGSVPVAGVMVTFTCPSAPGCTFPGGTSETDITDVNGNATSSTVTADATAGSYSVTGDFAGDAGTAASFSLTNNPAASGGLGDGNYTFFLSGFNVVHDSFSFVAGTFTVAGGVITGGEQDYVDFDNYGTQDAITSAGSSITTAASGNLQIVLATGDTAVGVNGVETINAALRLSNPNSAVLSEQDASGSAHRRNASTRPDGIAASAIGRLRFLGLRL